MKKIIIITSTLVCLVTSIIVVKYLKKPSSKTTYTIGILQTASHPALDASRDGFIESLQAKLGNKVDFIIQNAQGSVASAHAIAQQFKSNKNINAIYAIATPAAQAASALEKEKPIIIAAVTNPYAVGIMHPKTNVCGVTDMINVKALVEMLRELLPNAKTVGLLYTSGEKNSLVLAEKMRQELTAQGLTPTDFAMSSELDVAAITDLACRKSDVILAPTDNTVALSMTLIASIALKHNRPLLTSFNTAIDEGALAARGVDYKESGKQAGLVAYEAMVNGKKPCNLGVAQPESKKIVINQNTLGKLGLVLPESLKKTAELQ